MHWNKTFTTYRRELSGGTRGYSGSATITDGNCFFEPAGGDLKAVLGVDQAVKAYALITYESDFEKSDRVVIDSENYHIEDVEIQYLNGISLSRLVIVIDK